MNYFRKLVSGKRNRLKYQKYDLDITYVTRRVCGMSFPASGFEQMYRNNINDVAAFLEEKHKDHYLIFNLSNRKYDYKKFKGQVLEYKWEDHHSPAMNILFEVCQEMYKFLRKNHENIVIVNCNAGKGRTGTSIACFLMFSGLAENAVDAITYYGWKRFEHGRGVTQPSQVRYVHYFEGVYKRQIQSPSVKILQKIVITTVPKINKGICTPFIEVLSGKNFELIWSNKYSTNLKTYKYNPAFASSQQITIDIDQDPILCGDIYFRLMNKGSLKNKLICRFALNTAFITDNCYEFAKNTVDPDSIIKDEKISWDFKVTCYFRDFCSTCEPSMPVDNLCKKCVEQLGSEVSCWKTIKMILDNHPHPKYEEGVFMNFNSNQCDFQEEIKKKIPINCEEIQYFQEEQTDSDYEDEPKQKNGSTDISQLQNQLMNLNQQQIAFLNGINGINEESKDDSSSNKNSGNHFSNVKGQREAVSDDEEEKTDKSNINRKADLLDIENSDEEFQIKTGCTRKKSVDFNREKQTMLNKQTGNTMIEFLKAEELVQAAKMRKQTIYVKKRN